MNDTKDLAAALVAFQGDLEPVEKDSTNPFFKSKYASLQSVMSAIQPLLKKHKLAVSQFVSSSNDGSSALRTILMHESGQSIEDKMPLLLPVEHDEDKWDKDAQQLVTKRIVPTPQDQGSAITYARRYSLMAVLGVVADEDDDANKATQPYRSAGTNPPSDKQLNLIRSLCKQMGYDEENTEQRIAALKTSKDASSAIETLNDLLKDKG
jgi:hypothetical protein